MRREKMANEKGDVGEKNKGGGGGGSRNGGEKKEKSAILLFIAQKAFIAWSNWCSIVSDYF